MHNYWEDAPPLQVASSPVKWLALTKPSANEMLVVVASWSPRSVTAELRIRPQASGLTNLAGLRVLDAESSQELAPSAAAPFTVELPGIYGNRILRVTR